MRSKKFIITMYLAFGGIILGLYTNMGSTLGLESQLEAFEPKEKKRTGLESEVTLETLQGESLKLTKAMEETVKSETGRKLLKAQKRLVTARIATQEKVRNCSDLLDLDPYMVSGVYNVFPEGDLLNEVSTLCGVQEGRLVVEEESQMIRRSPACARDGSCVDNETFSHFVRCGNDRTRSRQHCAYPGIARPPHVKEQLSKTKCRFGKNFGFDASGLWTKDKCQAVFAVDLVNHLGRPAADELVCQPFELPRSCSKGKVRAVQINSMGCKVGVCVPKPKSCTSYRTAARHCSKKFRMDVSGELGPDGCYNYTCVKRRSRDDDD